MRITSNMIMNTVTRNLALSQSRFLRLQTMASSGRRINRPSDDPIGITKDLGFRSDLSEISQFRKNISQAISWFNFSDQAMGNMNELISEAKELAVQFANDTYDHNARAAGATNIRDIFEQMIEAANTQFEGNYIFSGTRTDVSPFMVLAMGVVYRGDFERISLETESSSYLRINSIGAEFLTVASRTLGDGHDLNPGIQPNLWLDYLHDGNGVDLGAGLFNVRTLNGDYIIDVSAARNIQDVLDALNGAGIPNFNASISLTGNSIALEDTSDHLINANTPLSMLNGGLGVDQTPGLIRFSTGGGVSVNVDISGCATVGDVINAINTQLPAGGINNVTASLHPDKNLLVLNDNNAVPLNVIISEGSPAGQTASDLGILGEIGSVLEGEDLEPTHIQVAENAPDENTAKYLGLLGESPYDQYVGEDLNPELAYFTLLSSLRSGLGYPLGKIRIINGDLVKDIDLTALGNDPNATIIDVVNLINSSGIEVEARINDQHTGIQIFSNVKDRSLVVIEADDGQTAKDLGIFGSPDILGNLMVLENALENNDVDEIGLCLETFDTALNKVSIARAEVGARTNRADMASYRQLTFELQVTEQLSNIEDADITKVITDLASAEAAYQAALASAARLIQPSLIRFLS
ncbi:MAG: flagellar hook-associated protein FlgL [Candidatus Zixiibacteriota bacterium]|nr:MAG: flagellar hook-associated protein FlgL [candidate division Zixibacteria bacterium]